MASGEVTGATREEVIQLKVDYFSTPMYREHDIPFEVAYCLSEIGKQPDDYEGEQRWCKKRVGKFDGRKKDYEPEAYLPCCRFHGGKSNAEHTTDNLEDPRTLNITHGLYTEPEHLRMDFNDAEQTLYDGIIEQWPEIYDWPPEEEDPARYEILDMVATNVVRRRRAEDYIDEEGEVRISDRYNDEGIVVEPDGEHQENPLAREYRLLMSEIRDMLKDLGLTPKERQKMDALESESSKNDAFAQIAASALDSDEEYDPERFNGEDEEDAPTG